MICAYCGKTAKPTREHIISNGVLDLFPECFMTIDNERNVLHTSDPVVKDVCDDCNKRRITYIDSYAKAIVKSNFLVEYGKDDSLNFSYIYSLVQKMCLKYAYNDLRSRKKDCSFFTRKILDYILNETEISPLRNVTILAGLAVNTSPVPNFIFGNNKIRWGDNPVMLENSIIENIDYDSGKIRFRENQKTQSFQSLAISYVFRFNSLQLLLFCWDENIDDDAIRSNNIILQCKYPYAILDNSGNSILSRCTSETTFHFERLVDVAWGQELFDTISYMRGTFSPESQNYLKKINKEWKKEENSLAEKHPR